MVLELPEPYIIVLEESENVPDSYDVILKQKNGSAMNYTCRVLKYWNYDLETLYEKNMYLLFPLKIFELRKRIHGYRKRKENTGNSGELKRTIRDDIVGLVDNIFKYSDNVYLENKITIEDYNEFSIIVENLFEHLNYELDTSGEIEKEVMVLVKTFYDKRVEERGIAIGIEKGIEKGLEKGIAEGETRKAIEAATNFLKLGVNEEIVAKGTGLPLEKVSEIKNKLTQ